LLRANVFFLLAVLGLRGQGIGKFEKAFPPEIGAPTITVSGVNGTAATLTSVDLSNLPQHTVKATHHRTAATFDGVLLKRWNGY
jgi:hypothetical protein